MTHKKVLRPGDRVTVKQGMHTNHVGTVLRREGAAYVIRLDSGSTLNRMASSLNKLPCSLSLQKEVPHGLG